MSTKRIELVERAAKCLDYMEKLGVVADAARHVVWHAEDGATIVGLDELEKAIQELDNA